MIEKITLKFKPKNRVWVVHFLLIWTLLLLLTGCSKSNDILTGKINAVKVEVLSTDHDKEKFFTLMPIVISTGKSTTINYVPIWNQIEKLEVKYKYEGKIYETRSDDFQVEVCSTKRYAKLEKADIGKKDAPLVLYTPNN